MPIENQSATLLSQLLRPAVRFALRRGVKIRTIVESLKNLLLEEAALELGRISEEPSVSKLSVMTGLQRREVQRVASPTSETAQHLDLMTRIIGAWCSDDRFSRGTKPRELANNGADGEFATLVRSVSQDLNPATVLFELERLRLVEHEGDIVRLLWSAYQISGDVDDAYTLLQRDIHTLVEGVDSNIRQESTIPNLHISTNFDNVSVDAVPEIREWILRKGAAFHAEVREYVGSFDKDINPSRYSQKGGAKITVGSFSLTESPEVVDAKK